MYGGRPRLLAPAACLLIISMLALSGAGSELPDGQGKIEQGLRIRAAYSGAGELIPVIIKFKEGPPAGHVASASGAVESVSDAISGSGKISHNYGIFRGIAAEVTREGIEKLASRPDVEAIVEDRKVKAFTGLNVGIVRANATWLLRLKSSNLTGKLTSVCVIDTGVDYTHPDLGNCTSAQFLDGNCSKVIAGWDIYNGDSDPMDDNGHGTHVAGIVAANGSLKGVAPDASIVAIKVLDENGDGFFSDINAGIEWCVSNASLYNITAISMSLGTTENYGGYCDNDNLVFEITSLYINNATDNNISVVVATGNDYNYTGISSPACIRNAIRVVATDNGDAFPGAGDFSNRGGGFPDILAAPGYGINSTVPAESACTGLPGEELCDDSLYDSLPGTSMAAPHVSGAIAIFAQAYKKLHGMLPRPSVVWSRLNSTGKPVSDSRTGLSFSRIDVRAAVGSILPLPVWGTIHSVHTGISDGAETRLERLSNLITGYDWASAVDHDSSITGDEWNLTKNDANGNNSDGNFTYFIGYEWKGTGFNNAEMSVFLMGNGPATHAKGNVANYDTLAEFLPWLAANNGMGCAVHPASGGRVWNWSDADASNETLIPCVEMLNKDEFQWSSHWNCSAGSGCATYANPSPVSGPDWSGSVKSALDSGLRLGFVAGWDYHGSYPGTPTAYTGLSASPNWTRQGVFHAIRKRHTWAAEKKIWMQVKASNGTSAFIMGDGFNTAVASLTINYSINASAGRTISNVSLFYDGIITNVTGFSGQRNVSGRFHANFSTGGHYVFLEAIQSDGKRAWSSPMYVNYIDLVKPAISIIFPANSTHSSNYMEFNITADEPLDWSAVQLLSTNHSMTNRSGQWQYLNTSLFDGAYRAVFWFNDTSGNMNSTARYFTIDTRAPNWSSNSTNITSAYSAARKSYFNVTWKDARLASVLIEGNWSGAPRNYTMLKRGSGPSIACTFNATLPAGGFYWKSWANDTAGNRNATSRWNFSIAKSQMRLRLLINGTDRNYSMNQSHWANITVLLSAAGSISLRINGSLKTYGNVARVENLSFFAGPGACNITARFSASQNYTANQSTRWLIVNDTEAPVVTGLSVSPPLALTGQNVTIMANVSDRSLDSVWYNVTNASGTVAAGIMRPAGGGFAANVTRGLAPGCYGAAVFANDSAGNRASQSGGAFRKASKVSVRLRFTSRGGGLENVTRIRFLYNGTGTSRNQTTGNRSAINFTVPAGLWDMEIAGRGFNVTLRDANVSRNRTINITMDWSIGTGRDDVPSAARSFARIVAANTSMRFDLAYVNVSFGVAGTANRSHISAYACHSWDIGAQDCTGKWVDADDDAAFHMARNVTVIGTATLSAFAVTQDRYCGDSICDSGIGEACSSCSSDCGQCQQGQQASSTGPGSSAASARLLITQYPQSVSSAANGSVSFQVTLRNNYGSNLTNLRLVFSSNCSLCLFSTVPSSVSLSPNQSITFASALQPGNSMTGVYGINITARSAQGIGSSAIALLYVADCVEGNSRCAGNSSQMCSGGRWSAATQCQWGCMNGACRQKPAEVCSTGQMRCYGSLLQQCRDDRAGWRLLMNCTQGCADNACIQPGGANVDTLIYTIAIIAAAALVAAAFFMRVRTDKKWKALEQKYRGIGEKQASAD